MSDREKRLLFLFLGVIFLLANFGALKLFYLPKLKEARSEATQLEESTEQAEMELESQSDLVDEVKWLEDYEGEPQTSQQAESELVQFVNREASNRRLEVKRRKIQNAITEEGLNYHRVRIELEVSGREQDLFGWIHQLNSPRDFRVVTMIRMFPKRDDDTQVDCQVVVEKWHVPQV